MILEFDFTTASPINSEKFAKQNKQVYDLLNKGETIHILKAVKMGIFNLHSRISDLRNKHGVVIYDKRITPEGISCNEYSLTPFITAQSN